MPLIHVNMPDFADEDPSEGENDEAPFENENDEDPSEEDDLEEQYHAVVRKPDPMAWLPGPTIGLPSEVMIGGSPHEVRVFEPMDSDSWDQLLGRYSPGTGVITGVISTRRAQSLSDQRDTMLHEVLHGVDQVAGTSAGEAVVEAWAPVLLDVLRSNPGLVAFLLADEDPRDE